MWSSRKWNAKTTDCPVYYETLSQHDGDGFMALCPPLKVSLLVVEDRVSVRESLNLSCPLDVSISIQGIQTESQRGTFRCFCVQAVTFLWIRVEIWGTACMVWVWCSRTRDIPTIFSTTDDRLEKNTALRRFHLNNPLQDNSLNSDFPHWSGMKMKKICDGNNWKEKSSLLVADWDCSKPVGFD